MNNLNIGKIITTPQQRDAVHMAIAPVVAGQELIPGFHIGIKDGKAYLHAPGFDPIGVVDPFLRCKVKPGQEFWILLYPGSITSLRHEWEHPAFAATESPKSDKSESEIWMRSWAVKHMGEDYYGDGDARPEEDAYQSAIQAGHDNHIGPYEDARDYIDNEWWNHWEIITGKRGDRDTYFSCSC